MLNFWPKYFCKFPTLNPYKKIHIALIEIFNTLKRHSHARKQNKPSCGPGKKQKYTEVRRS